VTRFLSRRVALAIPILLGVSLVVFFTIKLIPGDPVASLLGPNASPRDRAALVERLGLNQPLPRQYIAWLMGVGRGDLGRSIAKQTPVLPMVVSAMINTLILTMFAAVVAMVGGVALGLISALRRGRAAASAASATSLVAVSAPQYSVGLILIVVFAVTLGWFPAVGMYDARDQSLGSLLHHLVLPGITAALVPMGIIARMFRSSLLDELSKDYVEALRARGLPRRRVIVHAVHNTVPTMLTVAGLQFGYLLGGVVFVETIFSWPGVGLLVFQAISQRDLPVIQAGVLVSALAFVVLNLMVDAAHGAVDPRIRH
jgi:peptide/nickel transport system permease protein